MDSPPLSPTFQGYIATTQDALILFEACLSGDSNHIARRPDGRELPDLIKSGNVFIYEERSSSIKRWSDGVSWSPSRILGNFLVYRQLEQPFPPGEKKRARKQNKRSHSINKTTGHYASLSRTTNYNATVIASTFGKTVSNSIAKKLERSLVGSLVDSYGFKDEGLVKKSISVTVSGASHHLVSYYSVEDVINNKLTNPSRDPRFQNIIPRQDLVTKQKFRIPVDEVDSISHSESMMYQSASYIRDSRVPGGFGLSLGNNSIPNSGGYTNPLPTTWTGGNRSAPRLSITAAFNTEHGGYSPQGHSLPAFEQRVLVDSSISYNWHMIPRH